MNLISFFFKKEMSNNEIYSDDDDDTNYDTIIIQQSNEKLPILLNSSSRRKKTIETYIAPIQLRNTVYRCREFPKGVYINSFGEVCPNDSRSGVYQTDLNTNVKSNCDSDDNNTDIDFDLKDESDFDNDEDEDSEEEEEEEEEDEYSTENDYTDYENEEEDEDYGYEKEEYKPTKRKKQSLIEESNNFIDSFKVTNDLKRKHIKLLKLKNETEKIYKKWKLIKNNKFNMILSSNLFCSDPEVIFDFHLKTSKKNMIEANFNLVTKNIECECGNSKHVSILDHYDHLLESHN
jgi:hypothetical protein